MKTGKNPAQTGLESGLKNRLLSAVVGRLLGLHHLNPIYETWRVPDSGQPHVAPAFLDHVQKTLDAGIEVHLAHRLDDIPARGPVIFCANHPHGGMEGLLLSRLLLSRRPDLRVLTNEWLTRIPEVRDLFIGVDVLSDSAALRNQRAMKAVSQHLAGGGALLIFPAGMVAGIGWGRWGRDLTKGIVERRWSDMLGRLALRHGAACMPFFVHGRNSIGFYTAGLIHRRLRTALLAREFFNKRGRRLAVTCGTLLDSREMTDFDSAFRLTGYLQSRCASLARLTDDGVS